MIKRYLNYFLKSYSYFHRQEKCLGFPKIHTVELTNRCIMSCQMCPHSLMERKTGVMKFETFKTVVEQIQNYANKILCIHGMGDSLLHPDIGKFIEYADKKALKTTTSTNPSSLTLKTSRTILESNLGHLTIALDGANESTYKRIRGKNAKYDQAVENIIAFLDEKEKSGKENPRIELSIIRMKETEKEIDQFIKKWKIPQVDQVTVKDFTTWDGSQQNINSLAVECDSSKLQNNSNSSFACIRPWMVMSVLWDGRVVPCCYDYDGKYVLGNVHEKTLEEIWNGKQMRELRRNLLYNQKDLNPLCRNCKEKKGAPANRFYPLNIFSVIKQLGISNILGFIAKEGNVFIEK